jgi:antitoxin ParD1/3/4
VSTTTTTTTTTMHLELCEPLREFIDQRVRSGSYGGSNEYVRDLAGRDHEEPAKRRLRDLIEAGLSSGPAAELTPADRSAIQDRIASAGR